MSGLQYAVEDRKTNEITHLALRLGVKIAGDGTSGAYIRKGASWKRLFLCKLYIRWETCIRQHAMRRRKLEQKSEKKDPVCSYIYIYIYCFGSSIRDCV